MSNPTFYKANNLHLLIEDLTKDDADKFETPLYQFEYAAKMVEMANILIYKSTSLNKEQARQCEGFIVHGLPNENIEDIPLLPRSIVSFMRYVDQNKEIQDYVQKNINPQYSNHLMIQQMLKSQLMTTIQQVKKEPKLHLFHGTQRF